MDNEIIEKTNTSNNGKNIIITIISAVFVLLVLVYVVIIWPVQNATKQYNQAVEKYNEVSREYDSLLANVAVENISGMPNVAGALELVKDDIMSIIGVLISGNNKDKIVSDTETINNLCEIVSNGIIVIGQIDNPSDEWVLNRISEISDIDDAMCVTKERDPNQMLWKEGGYTGCVYFSLAKIDTSEIYGEDIIEKGTDAGGSIEIYESLEDAEARCEYLKGFDNTILYSGSYALLGTMVVRVSYILDGEQQFEITDTITRTLTEIK